MLRADYEDNRIEGQIIEIQFLYQKYFKWFDPISLLFVHKKSLNAEPSIFLVLTNMKIR